MHQIILEIIRRDGASTPSRIARILDVPREEIVAIVKHSPELCSNLRPHSPGRTPNPTCRSFFNHEPATKQQQQFTPAQTALEKKDMREGMHGQ